MKLKVLACLLLALALVPCACSAEKTMVLEQKDVQFFKVEEVKQQKIEVLKISGLAFHSSLAVETIKTEQKAKSLLVYVLLTPARAGLSGSFNFELSIPDFITDVRFGNSETVIWQRK